MRRSITVIKEIEIKYTMDLFDDNNSIIIGFDDQDQCFTRTFIDDNNEKVTMPISIEEILTFMKYELEYRLDPFGIKATMSKNKKNYDINKLPLGFRRCAANGCKNPPYMLDPKADESADYRFPDGTEGNTTLCKEHWDKANLLADKDDQ